MFKKCSVSYMQSPVLFWAKFCSLDSVLFCQNLKVSRKNMHIKPAISGKDKTKNTDAKINPWVVLFENV